MVLIFFAAIGSGVTEVALPYYNTVPVPVPGTVQYIEKNIIVTSYCTGAQVLIPDRTKYRTQLLLHCSFLSNWPAHHVLEAKN